MKNKILWILLLFININNNLIYCNKENSRKKDKKFRITKKRRNNIAKIIGICGVAIFSFYIVKYKKKRQRSIEQNDSLAPTEQTFQNQDDLNQEQDHLMLESIEQTFQNQDDLNPKPNDLILESTEQTFQNQDDLNQEQDHLMLEATEQTFQNQDDLNQEQDHLMLEATEQTFQNQDDLNQKQDHLMLESTEEEDKEEILSLDLEDYDHTLNNYTIPEDSQLSNFIKKIPENFQNFFIKKNNNSYKIHIPFDVLNQNKLKQYPHITELMQYLFILFHEQKNDWDIIQKYLKNIDKESDFYELKNEKNYNIPLQKFNQYCFKINQTYGKINISIFLKGLKEQELFNLSYDTGKKTIKHSINEDDHIIFNYLDNLYMISFLHKNQEIFSLNQKNDQWTIHDEKNKYPIYTKKITLNQINQNKLDEKSNLLKNIMNITNVTYEPIEKSNLDIIDFNLTEQQIKKIRNFNKPLDNIYENDKLKISLMNAIDNKIKELIKILFNICKNNKDDREIIKEYMIYDIIYGAGIYQLKNNTNFNDYYFRINSNDGCISISILKKHENKNYKALFDICYYSDDIHKGIRYSIDENYFIGLFLNNNYLSTIDYYNLKEHVCGFTLLENQKKNWRFGGRQTSLFINDIILPEEQINKTYEFLKEVLV